MKKYTQLMIAFCLGALITYLAMSLHIAKQELKAKTLLTEGEAKLDPPKQDNEEEKYWLDERIEQQNTETEERIKRQQSKGDDLKSRFEEFIE